MVLFPFGQCSDVEHKQCRSLPAHPRLNGLSDSLQSAHRSARRADLVLVIHVRRERFVALVALNFLRERRQLTHLARLADVATQSNALTLAVAWS
jgi:hypothetical protein